MLRSFKTVFPPVPDCMMEFVPEVNVNVTTMSNNGEKTRKHLLRVVSKSTSTYWGKICISVRTLQRILFLSSTFSQQPLPLPLSFHLLVEIQLNSKLCQSEKRRLTRTVIVAWKGDLSRISDSSWAEIQVNRGLGEPIEAGGDNLDSCCWKCWGKCPITTTAKVVESTSVAIVFVVCNRREMIEECV